MPCAGAGERLPSFGGFNYNSLDRTGIATFNPPLNSIQIETLMLKKYKAEAHIDSREDHKKYEAWRIKQYDDYSKYGGFEVPGVTYE